MVIFSNPLFASYSVYACNASIVSSLASARQIAKLASST